MQTDYNSPRVSNSRGVALVIVLAFVVLLTGLIIAFFSRSMLDRQISNSSVSRAKVNAFADGATDAIIGELKQEIVLGSSSNTITTGNVTTTLYTPLAPAYMLPQLSGTSGITATGLLYPYNLLKVSSTSQLFYSGSNGTIPSTGTNNVISVSSTTPSLNGRYLTPAYWNQHYLLPITSSTDSTPYTSGTITAFVPPSWILVARNGTNPISWNSNMVASSSNLSSVVGRYAFAIYHEGGLLDVNCAGYPAGSGSAAIIPNIAYKPGLAYADLTQLPGGLTSTQIDQLVAWRNFASIPVPGASSPASFLSPGFNNTSGSNYYNLISSNTTGYLAVNGTAVNSGQTDRMFTSRQELIKFVQNGLGVSGTSLNVLNYLTTFTRDLNQPSYIPPVQSNTSAPVVLTGSLGGNSAYVAPAGYADKLINPSFPTVRVQASFPRNDGSTANVGDPLVNKRFALNRLAWVTPFGPIADNNGNLNPTGNAAIQQIITAYQGDGISAQYLALGGTTNIAKYFGLNWDSANNRWNYNVHVGSSVIGGGTNNFIMLVGRPAGTGSNAATYVEDANRDPDFFELLKAGITVGSLGKAGLPSGSTVSSSQISGEGYSTWQVPVNERYAFDTSVDYHVIQLGANILSEVNPTSYSVRITFNDGSARGAWEFQGVTDLPYLGYVFNGVLRTQLPNPVPLGGPGRNADNSPYQYPTAVTGTTALTGSGNAYMVQVPAVWNPYDPNGTPGVVRPSRFRIVVDSNDPVSLSGSGSSSDLPMWHAAEGSADTSYYNYGNQGLLDRNPYYSTWCTGVGGTAERWTGTEGPGIGTPVSDAVTFTDGTGALYREPTLIFSTSAPGNATRMNAMASGSEANITGIDANPLPGESDGSTGPWAPLVLGQFPLAFANPPTSGTTTIYYAGMGAIGNAAGTNDSNRIYLTYRLQYADPITTGNWITYDTKYGRTTDGLFGFQYDFDHSSPGFTACVAQVPNIYNTYCWASAMDPRSARFGLFTDTMNAGRSTAWSACSPAALGWIFNSGSGTTSGTTTVGITYPIRQDNSVGLYFINLDASNVPSGGQTAGNGSGLLSLWNSSTTDIPYTSFLAGWTAAAMNINPHGYSTVWMFAPGMYAQNNPSAPFLQGSTIEPAYYADADGIVRRAAGAYVASGGTAGGISATTPVGLPPASIQGYTGAVSSLVAPAGATPFTQSQSRPLLLHRPFRSVAELGYVFRDLPWKDLDFFTPESGDAGLLDIFCINETASPTSLVAGKVNLNTAQAPVLTAIISGACVDDPKITNATVGSVSPSVSSTIATALVTRTSGTNFGPLENISELVGKWNAAVPASGTASGFIYSPSNSGASWGVDLPSPSYADGKLSFVGFSGASTISGTSGTLNNLSDAYANASYSNASLQTSMSQVMRFREAPVRALASVGQTRVWNLMIDVVAQTGRYPSSAASAPNPLSAFNVEGQQHYWVHVAIDRLTGQVLDKQIEVVKE
jgi:hypothetical protein